MMLIAPDHNFALESIRYDEQGLVPAIAQDYLDGTVLMLAWMNRQALEKTLATGDVWYWSRSRQELWHKGATSGHFQRLQSLRYDCDSDALLLTVQQVGEIACHTGQRSCFHQHPAGKQAPPADMLSQLYAVIGDRRDHPQPESYTCQLLAAGSNKILKKIGEESAEVVMACKDQDPEAIAAEVADLFYHTLVALVHQGVELRQVYQQLAQRRGSQHK